VIVAALEFGDAGGVDVEAGGGQLLAEFHRERQADVAQADDSDVKTVRVCHSWGECTCVCNVTGFS